MENVASWLVTRTATCPAWFMEISGANARYGPAEEVGARERAERAIGGDSQDDRLRCPRVAHAMTPASLITTEDGVPGPTASVRLSTAVSWAPSLRKTT